MRRIDSRFIYSFKNNKVYNTYIGNSGSTVTKTLSTDLGSNFEVSQSTFIPPSVNSEKPVSEAKAYTDPVSEPIITVTDDADRESVLSFSYDADAQLVAIECTDSDAVVKYTTSGREVSEKSKIYREPFAVQSGMVVKAKCFNSSKELIESAEYAVQ